MRRYWNIKPEWRGETAFIVGGGPSVTAEALASIRGRRTIAINSSYLTCPEADVLFFADLRWWRHHAERVGKVFKGRRVATCSGHAKGDSLLRLKRVDPAIGVAQRTHEVAMARTSLQGAISIAAHLGASRLVLLGADHKNGPAGETSHHEPHPWKRKPNTWEVKLKQLVAAKAPLDRMGIEVVNACPDSTVTWWRRTTIEEYLHEEREALGGDGGAPADAARGAAQDPG
jgi:hypothetical protein